MVDDIHIYKAKFGTEPSSKTIKPSVSFASKVFKGNGKESDPTDALANTSANGLVDSRLTVGRQSVDSRPTVGRLSTDCRLRRCSLFKLKPFKMRQ